MVLIFKNAQNAKQCFSVYVMYLGQPDPPSKTRQT